MPDDGRDPRGHRGRLRYGFSKAGIGGDLGPLITVLMLVAYPLDTALALPILMEGTCSRSALRAVLIVPLGAWAGRWAVSRVSPGVFHHVMTGMLAVSGLFLIFDS